MEFLAKLRPNREEFGLEVSGEVNRIPLLNEVLSGHLIWEFKRSFKINGGAGGIRTLGRLPYTRFPSVHHRPLGHHSRPASSLRIR